MPGPYHGHYPAPPFPPYSFHPGPGNFPGPGFESATYDSRDSRESSEVTGNNTEQVRQNGILFVRAAVDYTFQIRANFMHCRFLMVTFP